MITAKVFGRYLDGTRVTQQRKGLVGSLGTGALFLTSWILSWLTLPTQILSNDPASGTSGSGGTTTGQSHAFIPLDFLEGGEREWEYIGFFSLYVAWGVCDALLQVIIRHLATQTGGYVFLLH